MVNERCKIKGLFKYFWCVFALVFATFLCNSFTVSAKPTVSLPSKDDFKYEEGLTFYVGVDWAQISEVKYKFNSNDFITVSGPMSEGTSNGVTVKGYNSRTTPKAKELCNSVSYLACSDTIFEYKIASSSLIVPSKNTLASGTNTGTFNFTVYAKEWGNEEKTVSGLVYDNVAPSITSVSISRNDSLDKKYFKIGEVIKFDVFFSELSFVQANSSSPTYLNFDIGSSTFKATCSSNSNGSTASMTCTHTLKEGYTGSITNVKVVNATNIKDVYNNYMSVSTVSVSTVNNNDFLEIDSVKPIISSITATEGIYSKDAVVAVNVTFSEVVTAENINNIPTLTAKFGTGSNITCVYSSSSNTSITYGCSVGAKDQGEFEIVSLTGGVVKDVAGNSANLSIVQLTTKFTGVVADNSLPAVKNVSLDVKGCASNYCITGDTLSVTFNFNKSVEVKAREIVFMFDGVSASGEYTWIFYSAENKAVAEYVVKDGDNGVLSLSYSFSLKGNNGLTSNVSDSVEYEYSVDNASPELTFSGVYYNDVKVVNGVIYGTKGDTIVYKFNLNDSSSLTLDSDYIKVNDNVCVGISCDIFSVNSEIKDNVLLITVKMADYELTKEIVVSIGEDAIKDYFGNVLSSDYATNKIRFDSYSPIFEVEVYYPKYKGYENDNGWYLTSGNVVDFGIVSDDADLVGYCAVSDLAAECTKYQALNSSKYSYVLEDSDDGEYKHYIKVMDSAGNVSYREFNIVIKNVFEYSSNAGAVSKNHTVVADLALLGENTAFKYNWFKEGDSLNFNNSYDSIYKKEAMEFSGLTEYQGNYRLCINAESKNAILCSEYLAFDNKVDSFSVNVSSSWTNKEIVPVVDFNDSSAIKCLAIGKDVSSINCDSGLNAGVVVYRTSQAVSPFVKYSINSNGVYYFYIEDIIGNSKLISKTVTNIDNSAITIDVYNGDSVGYIENLENNSHKQSHKFKVVFDKNVNEGSTHSVYSYFFTKSNCNIVNEDSYKAYYLNSAYKNQISPSYKEIIISSPYVSGVYNLYIMAKDAAGNVSFESVNGIYVDVNGPEVNISSLDETNFITDFDLVVSIKDNDSKLDSNNVYYAFVTSLGQIDSLKTSDMFKYDGCGYASLTCSIVGDNLNYDGMVFLPTETYRLVVFAYDIAGNKGVATSDAFTKDTTVPNISIEVNESNHSIVTISASKSNSGTLSGVYYCVNDCLNDKEYNLDNFSAVNVGTFTSISRTINLNLIEGNNKLYVYAVDIYGNSSFVSKDIEYINNITVYSRGYLTSGVREANIIVHNLKAKDNVSIKYILTDIDSTEVFDEESINSDLIASCNIYSGVTCYLEDYRVISTGAYKISLTQDRRVIFYIYVNDELIYDYEGNLLELRVEDADPVISFDSRNPSVISTVRGNNIFNIRVDDYNLNNNLNGKYILTSSSLVSKNGFDSYHASCSSSSDCAVGEFTLSDGTASIEVDSNLSKFNSLSTGTYYLYVTVKDDSMNVGFEFDRVLVDNAAPVVSYSLNGSAYSTIVDEVYVNGAPIVKFSDSNLDYVEIYDVNDELVTVCYVNGTDNDVNCTKNSISIGFVVNGDAAYYYLNSGSYSIVAYDKLSNSKSVKIVDSSQSSYPVINLYKLVEGSYEKQSSVIKVYNDLDVLYLAVRDTDLSSINVVLYDSVKDKVGNTFRYTSVSSEWACLSDSAVCEYGKSLSELLGSSIGDYDTIIVEAVDNTSNLSRLTVKYDVTAPVITVLGVGDSILVNGKVYEITSGNVVEFEIGVNLTLTQFLGKVIVDVDGKTYSNVRYNESFSVIVDGDYNDNLFNEVGTYSIKLDYIDEAGNKAVSKTINVVINDNVRPTLQVIGVSNVLELNEEVTVSFIKATDNYGFKIDDELVKERMLYLEDSYSITRDGAYVTFDEVVVKASENVYKFSKSGVYVFTYKVKDFYDNESSVTQEIIVMDSQAPVMSYEGNSSEEVFVLDRVNGNVNIPSVSVKFPNAHDVGDEADKAVSYIGLYALSVNKEKYMIEDVYCSVSGDEVSCGFTKIGTYYLRFVASDDSGNVGVFDYEVKIKDVIAPEIKGITDKMVVKVSLAESFDVTEDIIDAYSVTVKDNYDSGLIFDYIVVESSEYAYEVEFRAIDASLNVTVIVVYVDVVDEIAPVTGDIEVDAKTALNNMPFNILGGSDNTNNWWHEFKVGDGEWIRYTKDSYLSFANNLSNNVKVCIKAVDNYSNEGEVKCVDVYVDTTAPVIEGINDGAIVDKQVTLTISDTSLTNVNVYYDGALSEVDLANLPITLTEVGIYSVEAIDELGNVTVVNFVIDLDKTVNIVNDINADEYTETAVSFDKRLLVRANVVYNEEGYGRVSVDLSDIEVNANDVVYVLGVVPNTKSTFVIFSITGENLDSYSSNIEVLKEGETFSDKYANEECFLMVNEEEYVYVLVQRNIAVSDLTTNVSDKEAESPFIKTAMIVLGSLALLMIGYQVIKFRRRVRAA